MEKTKETEVMHDGFRIDPDTGEILGTEKPEEWVPTTEKEVDWVMKKIFDAEAAEKHHLDRIEILTQNIQEMAKEEKRKADFLRYRYGGAIEHFAKNELESKKGKTLKMTYGQLSFRSSKGGLKVAIPSDVIEWARENAPNAIKITEKFLISDLTPEQRKLAEESENPGFEIVEPSETFTLKTGVNKK